MDHNKRKKILVASFLVSFFAVGLPYWLISYGTVNLPDALLNPALAIVAIAALAVTATRSASFIRGAVIIGASVPAAVMARVIFDCLLDPTAHNLWPFEIAIAIAVAAPPAGIGAALGAISSLLLHPRG